MHHNIHPQSFLIPVCKWRECHIKFEHTNLPTIASMYFVINLIFIIYFTIEQHSSFLVHFLLLALNCNAWMIFHQVVSEFLVWGLDEDSLFPKIRGQVGISLCNSSIGCFSCSQKFEMKVLTKQRIASKLYCKMNYTTMNIWTRHSTIYLRKISKLCLLPTCWVVSKNVFNSYSTNMFVYNVDISFKKMQ